MSLPLEDYALIGDTETAALVGRDGSIDWLCLPRFDSAACFAALLGTPEHGRWLVAPAGDAVLGRRAYRHGTLVLETEFETDAGAVRLIDFMPPRDHKCDVVRIVEGVRGRVEMRMELIIRFGYGMQVPWVRRRAHVIQVVAGPDALALRTPLELRGEGLHTVGTFTVSEGDRIPMVLSWFASHRRMPRRIEAERALEETERFWAGWTQDLRGIDGPYGDAVLRSLITLKALTFGPTGGIVAAPTTSLPEAIGGVRNWDYRYCWVRDATLTLDALLDAGAVGEAEAWRAWLLRAAAGSPGQLQIMYGPGGERLIREYELGWLPGYEGSAPVRVGNAAAEQFQLDVYGELMDALDRSRAHGLRDSSWIWDLQLAVIEFVEEHWADPDNGIWEVRGERRHFVHSRVMAWVAVDRAIRAVEEHGMRGPVERWRALRDTIHAEVCSRGWHEGKRSFTQYYGGDALDASTLMIPLVGFLPPDDERVIATVDAIQRELLVDGFVQRYRTHGTVDGLPGGEGAFLACSFWLVDNLALIGRVQEAKALFDDLLGLCNDVGLLSEEYDPVSKRLVGNFPQAFSHVGLVNSAGNVTRALAGDRRPPLRRARHPRGR